MTATRETVRDLDAAAAMMVRAWGERIARQRRALIVTDHPMTQAELAERVGTGQDQISKWERGAQEPRLANKYRLAQALECAPADLFPLRP